MKILIERSVLEQLGNYVEEAQENDGTAAGEKLLTEVDDLLDLPKTDGYAIPKNALWSADTMASAFYALHMLMGNPDATLDINMISEKIALGKEHADIYTTFRLADTEEVQL